METINFTIPFGDTSDYRKVAEKIAKDLLFCSWMVRAAKKSSDDDGIAADNFILMGWTINK